MKILITMVILLATLAATGTNILSGAMADLIILATLIVVLGPLRVLEFFGIGIKYLFKAVFTIIAIAGG